ncbi:hypothetical protein IWX84_002736 [Flavobacterium sp. CG_9.10]|nr:hypothetical protein [Flavobacterium sp. CG_9.10]MBG6111848.1 hypothetical protein [Flavobacterium sp. CG_9.10]
MLSIALMAVISSCGVGTEQEIKRTAGGNVVLKSDNFCSKKKTA